MSQDANGDAGWIWPEDQFIARMKRERQSRRWSQERLAEEVDKVTGGRLELHPTAFTKLERENDRRNLRLNEAFFISEALGLSIARMLSDDDLSSVQERLHTLEHKRDALQAEAHAALSELDRITALIVEIQGEITDLRNAGAERAESSDGARRSRTAGVKPVKAGTKPVRATSGPAWKARSRG
jgi:transcriptional regulator with XRE-family HTH domain